MFAPPLVITVVEATQSRMAAAFTEWERRYREEPDRFMSEAAKLLKETPQSYGEACAPYFLLILQEQAGARPAPAVYTSAPSDLPAIGAAYGGGLYAGLTLLDNRAHALVLLPGDDELNWKDALAWAERQGGVLPSRVDALVLWQNLPGEFRKEAYWTDTQHAAYSDYAWFQHFGGGTQDFYGISSKLRARAVRRLKI
ncbi:MAG: DUF1566 domain-containing protein [Sulfuricaulis sp.]|nr:DUF1566 domain-containing protein [Sulfuricaulis sp.]